jgi:small-conductance mechanosensitive channel
MILVGSTAWARAQALPGVPGLPPPAAKAAAKNELAAPTKDNPEATVAESAGTIDVNKRVDESRVKEFLEETLAKYPGVDEVHADVKGSVVTLTGHVDDEQVRDRIGQVALKVEGVVFVANQVKTDAQFLSAPQILFKRLGQYGGAIGRNWLLFLLSLALLSGAMLAARLFSRYSETLLAPFTENVLLRSVLGSLASAAIIAGGLLAALQVFGAASAVMSVLGLAGVAALAIGFAFRDITENFIASILLSARRPFHVGDYVEVAGRAGVVKALNTRATVLVTLDGKTMRIPNATVFKEIVSNASAATSSRSTFDVLIPYEASTVRAMELIGEALKGHEAILNDPPPRALVEELTPEGVKLRTHFWMPTHGVDGLKVNSDAKLKAKVALQEAGIRPPSTMLSLALASRVGVDVTQATPEDRSLREPAHRPPVVTETQARANLAQDSRAADRASDVKPKDEVMKHVRSMAAGEAAAEGANLLADGDAKDGRGEDGAKTDRREPEPATSER